MRFHCLQHVPFETPGLLADRLQARGHSLRITHLYADTGSHSPGASPSQAGPAFPSLEDFDGLIIMGGPMSIHDEAEFPWLRSEKELIAAAIRAEKKVLGICLGAQLIAAVSGARVYTNEEKEIGFFPVQWTDAAHQWIGKPEPLPVFHWHGETFTLPTGATLLASTVACTNQAFLLGENTLGLQFHPEVTPAIIRDMIAHEGHELVPAPYIQTAETILAQLPSVATSLTDGSHLAAEDHRAANPNARKWPLDASPLLDLLLDAFLHPITV